MTTAISEKEFTKYLMNEDTCCPICYRPYLPEPDPGKPDDLSLIKPGEAGFVMPVVLNCNHAVCEECSRLCYEPVVQFVGHGVRCLFHKRDQLGNPPYVCQFVSPMKTDELKQEVPELEAKLKKLQELSAEEQKKHEKEISNTKLDIQMHRDNRIISQVLRVRTEVLLGSINPKFNKDAYQKLKKDIDEINKEVVKNKGNPKRVRELSDERQKLLDDFSKTAEFYYWFKYCHGCQKPSTVICKKCNLPFCDECWNEHKKVDGHADSDKMTVEEYEKNKVQKHECDKCHKRAFKYCGICQKFLCRNRKDCYDPCMDPDHLLIDFDPLIAELKRAEATAMDNSRKMFIHDVHDYMEINPFLWQAADMECLHRTVWHQAYIAHQTAGGEDEIFE